MKRKKLTSIILWITAFAAAAALLLVSSTDWFIKEEKAQITRISVILDEETDEHYVNFKKGVEYAAVELHADVNVITLYENGDADQQRELLVREAQDGAQGLIVVPIDRTEAANLNTSGDVTVPVIFVNDDVVIQQDKQSGNMTCDYAEKGKELAEKIQGEPEEIVKVVFIASQELHGKGELFYKICAENLNCASELIISEKKKLSEEETGEVMMNASRTAVVALDLQSMHSIIGYTSELESKGFLPAHIYGLGCDIEVLNALRSGTIDGIYETDGFAMGYSSILALINRIEKTSLSIENQTFELFYIDRPALKSGEYEKMLYPIE